MKRVGLLCTPHFYWRIHLYLPRLVFLQRRKWQPTPVLLPGKVPWTEEPGGLQSMGSLGVRHDWATSLSLFTFMPWRKRQSSVLAWRIPGTGEPGGLPSMGSHRVGQDWSDLAAAAAVFLKFFPHWDPYFSIIIFCWNNELSLLQYTLCLSKWSLTSLCNKLEKVNHFIKY